MPNFDQQHLANQFRKYLLIRNNHSNNYSYKVPFENAAGNIYELLLTKTAGWCSGLVAYWLYLKRTNSEREFEEQLNYVLNWDADKFKQSYAIEDKVFERFFNNILFLQHDHNIRGTDSSDIPTTLNFLLDSADEKISPAEYSISFVFDLPTLERLFNTNVNPNKMIRFGNGFHTVGMMYNPPLHYVYDPSSTQGIIPCPTPLAAAKLVFDSLSKFCRSTQYIALNMSIFDLEGSTIPKYQDSYSTCALLLENAKYKRHVLQHPNIFRVCMRYHEQAILELLFRNDYKYVRSNLYLDNELGDAVADHQIEEVNYLLKHGLSLNYRSKDGETALGAAIAHKSPDMLFQLLKLGVDPNLPIAKGVSALDWCLTWDNKPALIILLAAGAHCSNNFLIELRRRYEKDTVEQILEHATILNFKLFHSNNKILEKLNITSEEILKLLGAAAKQIISKPLQNWSSQEQQAIVVIIKELQEITSQKVGFNPIKLYMFYKTNAIEQAIGKYLMQHGFDSIEVYLSTTHAIPTALINPILFSTNTDTKAEEISFEKDILPLLKLR